MELKLVEAVAGWTRAGSKYNFQVLTPSGMLDRVACCTAAAPRTGDRASTGRGSGAAMK